MTREQLQGAIGLLLSQSFGCDSSTAMNVSAEVMRLVQGAGAMTAPNPQTAGPSQPQVEAVPPLSDLQKQVSSQISQLFGTVKSQLSLEIDQKFQALLTQLRNPGSTTTTQPPTSSTGAP